MLQLTNRCYCSEPTVFPENWEQRGASLDCTWYIQYYFHDPLYKDEYPRGKYVKIKSGINRHKTLSSRRELVKMLLEDLLDDLTQKGYNPISKTFMIEEVKNEYEIDPNTPFIDALRKGYERIKCVKNTKDNIRYIINYCEKSAKQLRYSDMPIKDIRAKHVLLTIENCARIKDYWSDNQFNHYRAHLGMVFKELKKVQAIDANYCLEIEPLRKTKKLQRTYTTDERKAIDKHLRENHYTFWRYMQIFYHSGGRTTELLRLKESDVYLKQQEYKATIKKGKETVEVLKPIKDIVLSLWAELLASCRKGDYLFSRDLKPGPVSINNKQISKRWRKHVKEKLKIDNNFYPLKHQQTTEMVDILSQISPIHQAEEEAAKLNSHTTTVMVKTIYDVKNKKRKDDAIKSVWNDFAGEAG